MNRAEVIARLKAVEPQLKAHGVAALYLFGSHARDEARDDSDVDVFVDKAPERDFGFSEFMKAYQVLEGAFPGMEIGYGVREGLSKYIRADVEQQAIRIF
jgi:predicted nucleotidyltransferase